MSLDATKPEDVSIVNTFAALVREARAKINDLEAAILLHLTGAPIYEPIEVTGATHTILSDETFIKANAGVNSQNFTVDPAVLTLGITYVLKKTDATANTVTLNVGQGIFINDTLASVSLTLQYEVLRFISDGTGIQTC